MTTRDSLWKRLKKIWSIGWQPSTANPQQSASFMLMYNDRHIGTLRLKAGEWSFAYSAEFKERPNLRTITEFPMVDKVYRSKELWPFFAMRVPSLRQAGIKRIIELEHINEDDEAALLRRFGRKTVANPFELVDSN
jgi:HipA-like protein